MKLNTDVGFNEHDVTSSTGVVLRDTRGQFVAASSHALLYAPDVLCAESYDLLQELQLAVEMGRTRLVVKTCSTELTEIMNTGGVSYRPAAAVVGECRNMAKSSFEFSPRETNVVANEIAHRARLSPSDVWKEDTLISFDTPLSM